jgi:hypothetical protein
MLSLLYCLIREKFVPICFLKHLYTTIIVYAYIHKNNSIQNTHYKINQAKIINIPLNYSRLQTFKLVKKLNID